MESEFVSDSEGLTVLEDSEALVIDILMELLDAGSVETIDETLDDEAELEDAVELT